MPPSPAGEDHRGAAEPPSRERARRRGQAPSVTLRRPSKGASKKLEAVYQVPYQGPDHHGAGGLHGRGPRGRLRPLGRHAVPGGARRRSQAQGDRAAPRLRSRFTACISAAASAGAGDQLRARRPRNRQGSARGIPDQGPVDPGGRHRCTTSTVREARTTSSAAASTGRGSPSPGPSAS